MRRISLLAVATAAIALPLVAATPASADEGRCYTLGVPGQDHFMVCTFLPVDPTIK